MSTTDETTAFVTDYDADAAAWYGSQDEPATEYYDPNSEAAAGYYDQNAEAAAAYDDPNGDGAAAYYNENGEGYQYDAGYGNYYGEDASGGAEYYDPQWATGEYTYPQDYESEEATPVDDANAAEEHYWDSYYTGEDSGAIAGDNQADYQWAESVYANGESPEAVAGYGDPDAYWNPDVSDEALVSLGQDGVEGEGGAENSPETNQQSGSDQTAANIGEGGQETQRRSKKTDAESPSRKKKTREERVRQRQEHLEKQEEEKNKAKLEKTGSAGTAKLGQALHKRTGMFKNSSFVARERAKLQLKVRIARAVARKRMPLQVRVLTEPRKHLSPLEKYIGSAVETPLSCIYWSSIVGDLGRVRHLVEVEGVSPTDGTTDPWKLRQTPLHWAAKGGSTAVIEYLLQAGANPRTLDENGCLPLHLACWAGHIGATLTLLRASSTRDLYLRDYDGGLAPLDWASIRGHGKLIEAIMKYEDSQWLPKFVDDLIRGIVKYKIKLFKDPPKPAKVPATATGASTALAVAGAETTTTVAAAAVSADQPAVAEPPSTSTTEASKTAP